MINAGETIFYMAPKEKVAGQPIHNETLRQKDRVMTELWKAKAPKEQPKFGESLRSMNRVSRANDLFILFFYYNSNRCYKDLTIKDKYEN